MKISADKLPAILKREFSGLYVVSGDEPLLVEETLDHIRNTARANGFSEREVHHIEKSNAWTDILDGANSLSLFAEQKILEVRLAAKWINDPALLSYLDNPNPATALILITEKLTTKQQATPWGKKLEQAGTLVQIWPVDRPKLPQWIRERATRSGLQLSIAAIEELAECTEGNLLACAQEIEKLKMIFGEGAIDIEQMREAIGNSARYNVFGLVDHALSGDTVSCLRNLRGLRGEGTSDVIILWALTREIRQLLSSATKIDQGASPAQAIPSRGSWDKHPAMLQQALARHRPSALAGMLQQCARIDRMIKGAIKEDVVTALEALCAELAGTRLYGRTSAAA